MRIADTSLGLFDSYNFRGNCAGTGPIIWIAPMVPVTQRHLVKSIEWTHK